MPIQSVGDMSQQFQSLRHTGRIKSDLFTLAQELSTGQNSDPVAHLGAGIKQLEAVDREIGVLDRYAQTTAEIGQRLAFMQSALDGLSQIRQNVMDRTISISPESSNAAILDATVYSRDAFADMTSLLNKRSGDTALFSGTATNRAPLADADLMLADIEAAIAGLTDVASITAAIDDWFDSPTGGFATMGYLGDTGNPNDLRLGPNATISLDARADGEAPVSLLKGAAIAAIADQQNTAISMQTRAELVQKSVEVMFSAGDALTQLQASVGTAEGRVEEEKVAQAAQLTVFRINRNDLTTVDPFETASRLQDVQQQLEMHYTVTARLSRLSLVNYL